MLRLDNLKSPSFDPLIQGFRESLVPPPEVRRARPRKPGLFQRFLFARDYHLTFDAGVTIESHKRGFGFASGSHGDHFIQAHPGDHPPEDVEAILAIGRVVSRGGRQVRKPRYVLLGYRDATGTVRHCRRSWVHLHGAPVSSYLLILGVLVGLYHGFHAEIMEFARSPLAMFMMVIHIGEIWLYLYTPFVLVIKPWQIWRARRRFKRHCQQLNELAG